MDCWLMSMVRLLSMENGNKKSTQMIPSGPLKMVKCKLTKENISMLWLKSGKIKQVGGILPSKVIVKSTLKKLTQNHQNCQN